MNILTASLKATFILLIIWVLATHQLRSPRVLVLHSYSPDYSWTQEEDRGLRDFFRQYGSNRLYWHYMDLKRHHDANFQRTAARQAMDAIAYWDPDVLIVFDDIAQALVGQYYRDHPHIKLVFAGVNNQPSAYGYQYASNVTGVIERKPLRAVDDAIHAIWNAEGTRTTLPQVLLLGDGSFDFTASLNEYQAYQGHWKHLIWLPPRSAQTFEEWKKQVFRAANYADFIVVSDYRQVRQASDTPRMVPADEVMRWTEAHAKVPVLGLTTAATEDGAMLGVATSGHEQGWEAAALAQAILRGAPPSSLPVREGSQSMISLRQSALAKRGLEIPQVYEAFAKANGLYYP